MLFRPKLKLIKKTPTTLVYTTPLWQLISSILVAIFLFGITSWLIWQSVIYTYFYLHRMPEDIIKDVCVPIVTLIFAFTIAFCLKKTLWVFNNKTINITEYSLLSITEAEYNYNDIKNIDIEKRREKAVGSSFYCYVVRFHIDDDIYDFTSFRNKENSVSLINELKEFMH